MNYEDLNDIDSIISVEINDEERQQIMESTQDYTDTDYLKLGGAQGGLIVGNFEQTTNGNKK